MLQCRLSIPSFSGSHCNIKNLTVKTMNLFEIVFWSKLLPKELSNFRFWNFPIFPFRHFLLMCASQFQYLHVLYGKMNKVNGSLFIYLSIYSLKYRIVYIFIFMIPLFYVWHLFKFRFFTFVHENSTLTKGLDFILYIY